MLFIKQKKQFLLTGAFFLALLFSFLLNSNLEINLTFAQNATLGTPDASNAPSTLNNVKSLASGSSGGDQCWLSMGCFFTKLIYTILVVCAFFAGVAATMFSYVIDVSHFQAIMSNPVIWEMWKIVRDFMNLFFIFVLLMSAFYTIFQVDKYSYKNVLSKVIFGALFVNFSFPIARAIIDVGNVMMYSFINDIFGMTGGTLTSGILSGSGLMAIFLPGSKGEFDSSLELKFYFIAIICMFMFMVSFLTLSLMMLYRMVMLPILVMFSPIGFVAGAIPGMDGYAKQWWDKLIKNVFFGPIAVFMMMIAVKFLAVWGSANSVMNFSKEAIAAENGTLISGIVYMAIPIIFFWIAITSAEKMSSEAGGLANSFGSKFLKKAGGWGMKRAWQATGKNYVDGMKDKYNRTFHEPRGLGYSWRAKQAELKKNDDEKRKQEDEAKAKPGQEAARASMNKSDMAIIAKGKAPGASAKQKAAGLAAQKRYNKRLQTSNVEEMKKQKESIENSGLVGIDSTSDEAFKMTNPHAPGFDVTRDGYAKRAANAEKFKTSLNDRDEFVDFVRRDVPSASSKINSLIGMSVADAVPRHIKGTPKEAGFIAEYTARQSRANGARGRINAALVVNPNAVLDKGDLASMRSFMSWRMDHVVGEGADFDTDRDPIIP